MLKTSDEVPLNPNSPRGREAFFGSIERSQGGGAGALLLMKNYLGELHILINRARALDLRIGGIFFGQGSAGGPPLGLVGGSAGPGCPFGASFYKESRRPKVPANSVLTLDLSRALEASQSSLSTIEKLAAGGIPPPGSLTAGGGSLPIWGRSLTPPPRPILFHQAQKFLAHCF